MKELKQLAEHAARNRIRGRSYKRNSLLKPLDIVLAELERCPDPNNSNERDFARDSSKGLIYDHVKRISRGVHEEAIYRYVDLFFEGILVDVHHGNIPKILQRERSLRSAYLVYMREALAAIFVEQGKAKSDADALQQMDVSDEREVDENLGGLSTRL
jgi:CRISPR-associated protein Csc3